jgi:hypothetical protein
MRIPEKYLQKIETIKKAILVRSQLLSEFGKDVKIEVLNMDYNSEVTYEIVLELEIKGIIDCPDCAHFPEHILRVMEEYREKVYLASTFYLDKDLTIKSGHSLRGVLVDSFNYNFDQITNLTFSIFFDPGDNY